MPLPSCRLCGHTDPARMIGLMTLWFGRFVEIEPAQGYFYLCPECFETLVEPHLGEEDEPEEEPDVEEPDVEPDVEEQPDVEEPEAE